MRIPVIRGIIDRRILINYRVDGRLLEQSLQDALVEIDGNTRSTNGEKRKAVS